MDYSENFLTQDQVEKIVELPFISIYEMLDRYVYYKGLVYGLENEVTYVDGWFLIETTELDYSIYNQEDLEEFKRLNPEANEFLISMKGCEYSNYGELINVDVALKSSHELDVILYSYDQLCSLMKKLDCPAPKPLNELTKKEYAYDLELVNQKSNFTLEEACRIAANLSLKEAVTNQQKLITKTGKQPISPLVSHYQEVISECVKGQNQHGFHLVTQELWAHSFDYDYGEPCSRKYDNGTKLVVSANVNMELTIISKIEFLRWCKYIDIETGLSLNQKLIDDSVEALKIKLDESEKEVDRLRDLIFTDMGNTVSNEESYPPELQLAIDAYIQLCLNKDKLPTNKKLEEWLEKESKERGITHKDGSKELKGLSNKKLETIPSIIKS